MLLSDSFTSCLHSLLGYSTGEFQALQLIVKAVPFYSNNTSHPIFKHNENVFIYSNILSGCLKFGVDIYCMKKLPPFKHSKVDTLIVWFHTTGEQCISATNLVILSCLTNEKIQGYIFFMDMRANSWTQCYRLAFQRETWQVEKLHMVVYYTIHVNVRIHALVSPLSLKYTVDLLHYRYWAVDMGTGIFPTKHISLQFPFWSR